MRISFLLWSRNWGDRIDYGMHPQCVIKLIDVRPYLELGIRARWAAASSIDWKPRRRFPRPDVCLKRSTPWLGWLALRCGLCNSQFGGSFISGYRTEYRSGDETHVDLGMVIGISCGKSNVVPSICRTRLSQSVRIQYLMLSSNRY